MPFLYILGGAFAGWYLGDHYGRSRDELVNAQNIITDLHRKEIAHRERGSIPTPPQAIHHTQGYWPYR